MSYLPWWRPAPGIWRASAVGTLASLCGVALTATSGWLIVQAHTRPVILTLMTAIVAVRAFGIGRPVLRYAERILSHDAALADLVRRRTRTYRRLIPLTPVGLGRRRRGDLMAGLVHDLDDEVDVQVRALVPLITAGLTGVTVVALAWAFAPPVGEILLALMLVCGSTTVACTVWERRSAARALDARAAVHESAQLALTDTTSIRAAGATEDVLARLDAAQSALSAATRSQTRSQALAAGVVPALVGAATASVAWPLHTALGAGTMSGAVAAMLLLTPIALTDVLGAVPEAGQALIRGRAAHNRLESVLSQERPPLAEGRHRVDSASPPTIRLDAVTASWDGHRIDLPSTTATIRPGEHVGIAGANGAGKSTLLALIARQLEPLSGTYRLNGRDIDAHDATAVRSLFAIVDDDPHVFAGTVRANVVLAAPGADDAQVRDALTRAGLAGWLRSLPDGLDTLLGLGGQDISGGERARLSLARALLGERPVILLDEPVAHLDHPTATRVIADMLAAARGRTVVAVSHQHDGLIGCDRLIGVGSETAVDPRPARPGSTAATSPSSEPRDTVLS